MFRKMIPLAVAIVLVIGCKKKSEEEGDGGGSGDPAPSGPAITIKIREEQQGDKIAVTMSMVANVSVNASGPKGKKSKSQKETEKSEYTETIIQMPARSDHPTKETREYKVAEQSEDGGPAKSLSYAKKTVLIEKKGGGYTYSVNGTSLPGNEAKKFRNIFEKSTKMKSEDFLPKKPVQVYERWTFDQTTLKKIGDDFELLVNPEKSSGSGRLTRNYTKDGQQWGIIEIKVALVVDRTKAGMSMTGNVGITLTFDTVIDGSAPEGTMKMKMNGTIITKQPVTGVEAETTVDMNLEETRTPVK